MPNQKEKNWVKDLISTLGFPIVVAGWLLFERHTMMEQHRETLIDLTNAINSNSELIRQIVGG